MKSTLSENELEMYANYKDLEYPEEFEKYSPKMPRFSAGTGVKRTFGSVMWNKEGVTFYEKPTKYGLRLSGMARFGIGCVLVGTLG